jgi:hypothetical protein
MVLLRSFTVILALGGAFIAGALVGISHAERATAAVARERVAVPMASWAAEPQKAPELVRPVDMMADVEDPPAPRAAAPADFRPWWWTPDCKTSDYLDGNYHCRKRGQ